MMPTLRHDIPMPPTAEMALTLVDYLAALIEAIWDYHGTDMVALLRQRPLDYAPEPEPDYLDGLDGLDDEIPF